MAAGRVRNAVGNVLLVAFAVAAAVVIVEVALARLGPNETFGAATELEWMRNSPGMRRWFTIDPAFGFRPILGEGAYSRFGTLENQYSLEKRAGVQRLLFLGDSVTRRAHLVDALRSIHGEEKFEYWNAGVESFNTVQEVDFYEAFNAPIDADQLILTFHNNDFESTPVAFFDAEDRLVVYAPGRHLEPRGRALFARSRLYRRWLAFRLGGTRDEDAIHERVAASLTALKQHADAEGRRLTVILLPILSPVAEWTDQERRSREASIRLFESMELRWFDLLDVLEVALLEGIDPQEYPDDTWHPSPEMARRFAESLHRRGLLE